MSDNPLPRLAAPDPLVAAQWAGLARTLIAALAGAGLLGAAWTAVSLEQLTNYATLLLMLVSAAGGAWSAYRSWRQKAEAAAAARRGEVSAAKASAQIGVPVTVTETPPGHENRAVLITPAEQAAAPSAPVNVMPSPPPPPPTA